MSMTDEREHGVPARLHVVCTDQDRTLFEYRQQQRLDFQIQRLVSKSNVKRLWRREYVAFFLRVCPFRRFSPNEAVGTLNK